MDTPPLVSIGIPTYNRAGSLTRALESVMAQDYPHWEALISDNASSDETEAICQRFCAQDVRIRFIRQPRNSGAHGNFNFVLQESGSKYFLWLADDDWLCPGFLAQCVAALEQDPDCALALGQVNYFQGDQFVYREPPIVLCQKSGSERVLSYYASVTDNGQMYSLMRRSLLTSALMPRNVIGGDWLFIAALVFQGKARTLETTCVNRSLGGTSQNVRNIGLNLNLSRIQTNHPYLCISGFAFQETAWTSPAYASLNGMARPALAVKIVGLIWRRYGFRVYFHAMITAVVALAQHAAPAGLYRRLRVLYRKATLLDHEQPGQKE